MIKMINAHNKMILTKNEQRYAQLFKSNQIKQIKKALNAGADVNMMMDTEETTPLHQAISKGNLEACQLLIQHGADVNLKYNNDLSPLALAAQRGYTAIFELLLQHGAKVDSQDNMGNTLLHWAAYNGNQEIVNKLIELGVDGAAKNEAGKNAAHIAAEFGNVEVLKALGDHYPNALDEKDLNGNTPLLRAACNTELEAFAYLLNAGTDCAIQNKEQKNALMLCMENVCKANKFEIAALLLDKLSSNELINAQDRTGKTPLMRVMENKRIDLLELMLLQKEIDVNIKNNIGMSALHYGVQSGWVQGIEELLNYGADVNLSGERGNTPLMDSILWDKTECAFVLLAHDNIKVNIKNAEGNTALMIALQTGHFDVARLLIDKGADVLDVNDKGIPVKRFLEATSAPHDKNYRKMKLILERTMQRVLQQKKGYDNKDFNDALPAWLVRRMKQKESRQNG